MKQRVISGCVGGVILFIILFLRDTLAFALFISFLSLLAMEEILKSLKIFNLPFRIWGVVYGAAVPLVCNFFYTDGALPMLFVFLMVLIVLMAFVRKSVTLEQFALTFLMGSFIPLSFSTFLWLRDLPLHASFGYEKIDGLFLILYALVAAWATDIGAYFIGRFFGRHKLAPEISPNKTIEGAVGGILSVALGVFLLCLIWQLAVVRGTGMVRVGWLTVLSVVCAVLGMIGDLAASYVKRMCKIKDFGRILPGHGGVMDRFDSVLLVGPFLCIVLQWFPTILRFTR